MLRLIHLIRRKAGMSPAEFRDGLRDVHGPLVAAHQTDLDLVRYAQLHPDPADQGLDRQACSARGMTGAAFDAAAEYWWRSEGAFLAALATERGRAAAGLLASREAEWTESSASPMWLACEYPQVATGFARPVARFRTGVMRLLFAFQALPTLTDEQARRYWLAEHGPLVRSHSAARGLLAYNQVHRIDGRALEAWPAAAAVEAPPFLGHAESWFDRLSAPSGPELEDAKQAALADERRFIDWSRATIIVGKECVFVDRDWAPYGERM
jgi:hypothetical protein